MMNFQARELLLLLLLFLFLLSAVVIGVFLLRRMLHRTKTPEGIKNEQLEALEKPGQS
jgi:uncharacterized protein YneF (UPF0154 family)